MFPLSDELVAAQIILPFQHSASASLPTPLSVSFNLFFFTNDNVTGLADAISSVVATAHSYGQKGEVEGKRGNAPLVVGALFNLLNPCSAFPSAKVNENIVRNFGFIRQSMIPHPTALVYVKRRTMSEKEQKGGKKTDARRPGRTEEEEEEEAVEDLLQLQVKRS